MQKCNVYTNAIQVNAFKHNTQTKKNQHMRNCKTTIPKNIWPSNCWIQKISQVKVVGGGGVEGRQDSGAGAMCFKTCFNRNPLLLRITFVYQKQFFLRLFIMPRKILVKRNTDKWLR